MKHFLSPKELAIVLGVSESSIKRWVDDGAITSSRTAGGHRRISVSDALHFVRQKGLTLAKAELLGLPSLGGDSSHQQSAVKDFLLHGDRKGLERILVDHYVSGGALATLCDGPIRTAFNEIGTLWQHQGDGILIEHRAVDVCLQALNTLRNLLPQTAPDAPCALGGAPADDPYLLPSLMASIVLAESGWRTINVGPNTPWETFHTACLQLHPQLLWITVSSPPQPEVISDAHKYLPLIGDLGVTVAVGGRNAQAFSFPQGQRPATMAELQRIAHELRSSAVESGVL